jgi:uncharacterized repeat protein (TIGR01451 family)
MKNHPMRIVGILLGMLLGAVPLAHAGVGVNGTFTSKVFSPSTIAPSGTSTVTLTITNNTAVQINTTFTDTFPAGMTFVSFPAVPFSAGCAGGSTMTGNPTNLVASLNVAASTSCVVSFAVIAGTGGSYVNGPSNISGWNGNALAFAPAVLFVLANPVPTLSEFALILLALGLAVVTYRIRFRRARSGADPPA